jgi:hypothetical protein
MLLNLDKTMFEVGAKQLLSPFLGKNMYEKSHFGYIPATLKNYAMSP